MTIVANKRGRGLGLLNLLDRYLCEGSRIGRISAGVLMAAASAVPAIAQDQIVLKAAHLFPNSLYVWKEGPQVFIDEVEKASNGRIKFEVYPSGQLGKDTVSALEHGIADVAILIPSYTPDKLPLSSVAELPGLLPESCEGTEKLWQIAKPGGVLHEAEYTPKNIRLLMADVFPPYVIMTTRRSPDNLDAIKGLKFRANGNSMKKTVAALGGVAVQVPTTELYDALSRGTIDGGLNNYMSMPDYDLQAHVKYSVEGPNLGSGSISLGIRKATWDSLPDDMKEVFEKAGLVAQKHMCEWMEKATADIRKEIVEKDGHTVVALSPEETTKWQEHVTHVVDAWVAEMKSVGKDGTAILDALKAN